MLYALSINIRFRDLGRRGVHVLKSKVSFKPRSHCADVATVHPDTGQLVYRDAPGHIS